MSLDVPITFKQEGTVIDVVLKLPKELVSEDIIAKFTANTVTILDQKKGVVLFHSFLPSYIIPEKCNFFIRSTNQCHLHMEKKSFNERVKIWNILFKLPLSISTEYKIVPTNSILGEEFQSSDLKEEIISNLKSFQELQTDFLSNFKFDDDLTYINDDNTIQPKIISSKNNDSAFYDVKFALNDMDEKELKKMAIKIFFDGMKQNTMTEEKTMTNSEIFQNYLKSANLGNEDAQTTIGEILTHSTNPLIYGLRKDVDKGLKYLKLATYSNYSERCALILGAIFRTGKDVEKNEKMSKMFLCFSAIRGSADACRYLAMGEFENGNKSNAVEWLRFGVNRGSGRCAYELGKYYLDVEKNVELAREYYVLANKWEKKFKVPKSVHNDEDKTIEDNAQKILQNVLSGLVTSAVSKSESTDNRPAPVLPVQEVIKKDVEDEGEVVIIDEKKKKNSKDVDEEISKSEIKEFDLLDEGMKKNENVKKIEDPKKKKESSIMDSVKNAIPTVVSYGLVIAVGYIIWRKFK